jgi:hypothetical protein
MATLHQLARLLAVTLTKTVEQGATPPACGLIERIPLAGTEVSFTELLQASRLAAPLVAKIAVFRLLLAI